ncbi:exodeoxyribonuclease VII large subunit [Jannaschia sp. KMU-145]|uniref:exodeoxyribonuclease VII large subunit n=1 Tax=Jannaschia halovivens TaxID=3388667 RepID=UPI00396B3267
MDDLIDDSRPGRNEAEFTVSEISGAVKKTLEGTFGRVRVRGEVSKVMRARSGHLYFDIKDDRSVLSCTSWKGQVAGLSVIPEEGMEIVATGKMTSFAASMSKYQLNVDEVQVAGQGALLAMLEKRRAQLAAEGLFEPSSKRPIPYLPDVIGVVTSPQGAVIRDILHRLADRFPRHVLIWPVAVQGKASAGEVARAIRGFDALAPGGAIPRPDLLIVARGGGSIEDLWGFNEEVVVRAVADCTIPLISAVGHETDTMLIDHAADRRAPTPTAAAEMAVPVRLDLAATIRDLATRQARAARGHVTARRQRLTDLARGLPRPDAVLAGPAQRLDTLSERLPVALRARTARARVAFSRLEGRSTPRALVARVAERRRTLAALAARLDAGLPRRRTEAQARLDRVASSLLRAGDRLGERPAARLAALRLRTDALTRATARARERLDARLRRLSDVAGGGQRARAQHLAALGRLNETLSHNATLARGFAIVRDGDDTVLTTAGEARASARLKIEFKDGRVALGAPARRKAKPPPPDQGTLL